MNILVVDDLYEVVQGVVEGVRWRDLGVEDVYAAYSVEGAQDILRRHGVQLLLCDIEMPPRSGFELLEWLRAEEMETECIFLSSHAEFEYAQAAVKLGSFDYILQPARYEEIEAAVRRAIVRIEEKRRARAAAQYGQYWREKEGMLADACVARFLLGEGGGLDGFLEDLSRLGAALGRATELCPLLVQLHRPVLPEDRGALRSLFFALLRRTERTLLLARMEDGCFFALLFGGDVQWAEIVEPLKTLTECWKAQGRGPRPTCYVGDTVLPSGLPAQWKLLDERRRDNVAHYGGVFAPLQKEEILHYIYTFPDMQRWARQLTAGDCDQVREEALAYLREQRDLGKVNAEFLAKFHQDFIQMFFTVAQAYKARAHDIFYEAYPFKDFLQAYTSYEKMISLVRFATDYVRERIGAPERAESPVEQAIHYIQQNIEKDMRRSDVAEAIYMNADYLARLFKKERGVSLGDFIVSEKMRVAASLLSGTNIPVSLVASKVGYSNFSYFSQVFKRQTGSAPGEYRLAYREGGAAHK